MNNFDFVLVDHDAYLLNETYKLRYEIYCLENGFIDKKDFSDGVEKDSYDDFSIHFAAISNDGDVVGTLRLVLDSTLGFPMTRYCKSLYFDKKRKTNQVFGEVSRFAVNKKFQRGNKNYTKNKTTSTNFKEKDFAHTLKILDNSERPFVSHHSTVTFGLIKALYQESKRLGITHWYAAMEKRLWYSLKKFFSFNFQQIGPEIDYFGPVRPYLANLSSDIEQNVLVEKPKIIENLTNGLDFQYWPTSWQNLFQPKNMPNPFQYKVATQK